MDNTECNCLCVWGGGMCMCEAVCKGWGVGKCGMAVKVDKCIAM